MLKIATPLSDLFENENHAREIMLYSDCLEGRDAMLENNLPGQEVFHCDFQPIHDFNSGEIKYLEKISTLKSELRLISFHIASSCRDPELVDGKFICGGKLNSRQDLLNAAGRNFKIIKDIFSRGVTIAIENNNYLFTEAYEHVTDPDFLEELVRENDIYLLLDIAHAKITAINKKIDLHAYVNALPLDRMIQLHLSVPGQLEEEGVYDAHDCPGKKEFAELREYLHKYPSVQYVTVEYYKNKNILVSCLKKLGRIARELSEEPVQS